MLPTISAKPSRLIPALVLLSSFAALAQTRDGTDINKSIPIFFGQTVTDFLDASAGPSNLVYSIALSKGQTVNITMSNTPSRRVGVCLLPPNTLTLSTGKCVAYTGTGGSATFGTLAMSYDVATSGTYYVNPSTLDPSSKFQLQVTATGTPILVPNPTTAGCLSGRVDSITYSLQLIAANLADEVSIGGQRACAACTVKNPLSPEVVARMDSALRAKVNVEACYDSSGNIFQVKLIQQ